MFIFGCSGSELRHAGSLPGHVGLPSSGGTRPRSCCEWSSSPHGAGALRSRTGGGPCVPCMGRQTLTPGPPGEALGSTCLCRCRKRADEEEQEQKARHTGTFRWLGGCAGPRGRKLGLGRRIGVWCTRTWGGWCREVTEGSWAPSGEPSCGEARWAAWRGGSWLGHRDLQWPLMWELGFPQPHIFHFPLSSSCWSACIVERSEFQKFPPTSGILWDELIHTQWTGSCSPVTGSSLAFPLHRDKAVHLGALRQSPAGRAGDPHPASQGQDNGCEPCKRQHPADNPGTALPLSEVGLRTSRAWAWQRGGRIGCRQAGAPGGCRNRVTEGCCPSRQGAKWQTGDRQGPDLALEWTKSRNSLPQGPAEPWALLASPGSRPPLRLLQGPSALCSDARSSPACCCGGSSLVHCRARPWLHAAGLACHWEKPML